MNSGPLQNISLRKLAAGEDIPYELLLLADETKEAIDRYIPGAEIYVHEKENRPIAVIVLQAAGNEGIEIKNIAVESGFQGNSIGTAMIHTIAAMAMQRGCTHLLIGTGDHATRELALYRKLGFKDFKVIKDFFIDNYPEPIFENGNQLKDMILLKKNI